MGTSGKIVIIMMMTITELWIICSLCNDSLLFANDAEEIKDGEEVLRDGSPTEAALRVLAEKIGFFEGMLNSCKIEKI